MQRYDSHLLYYLAPSGPPLNLTLVNANQTSFNVMWFPPALIERNGKIVSYMVQVTRVKINQTRSFEHQLNNLFLQGKILVVSV